MKPLVLALIPACLVLALAACGGDGGAHSAGPAPSAAVEEVSEEMPAFELWFIGDTHGSCCGIQKVSRTAEELGIPHAGKDFAVGPHLITTLVEALLAGPSRKEAALGFGRVLPGDVRLLGVSIENGIVTLDLSSEFKDNRGSGFVGLGGLFQLASVVYTVTQFPEIRGVRFKVEGRPIDVPPGSEPSFQGILPGCDIHEAEELLDRPVTRADYPLVPTAGELTSVESPRDGQIVIKAEFDAPKHLLYKAWTTPELVERWWGGRCGKVTAEIDLRVGGIWQNRMVTSRGDEVVAHGTYREIVPNERIVATEVYDVHYLEPQILRQPRLNTVTFTEANGRTTLTILVESPSKQIDMPFGLGGVDLQRVADSLR